MSNVLIAGGGLAGSGVAIQLGRLGVSAELFECGRFPKEKTLRRSVDGSWRHVVADALGP
jgi:flavin-dependent dehydrogenase